MATTRTAEQIAANNAGTPWMNIPGTPEYAANVGGQGSSQGTTSSSTGSVTRTPEQIHAHEAGGTPWLNIPGTPEFEANNGGGSGLTNSDQVTPYLNDYQRKLAELGDAPEVRVPTMEELKTQLAPTTPAPAPLNRVAEFENLRTTYGVTELEQSLTTIKDQITAEQDMLREQRGIEEGKPVPLGVIAGRVTEEERVANQRIDALGRQQARIVDELNTKYTVINAYMSFKGLDYQDAVAAYDKDFNRNLDMYNVITGAEERKATLYQQQKTALRGEYEFDVQLAKSIAEDDKAAARANLTTYTNAAINGNVDYNSLSADQKLQISKLEVQAGLPVGFISSIQKDPKANILFTSTNEGVTQIGIRNADGTVSVESYGTSTAKEPTATSAINATNNELKNFIIAKHTLDDTFKQFGDSVSPNTILETYNKYSPYGEAKESAAKLKKKYNVTSGETTTKSTVSNADINKAKQLLMKNGGSDADIKQAETDADFVNYVIANFQ